MQSFIEIIIRYSIFYFLWKSFIKDFTGTAFEAIAKAGIIGEITQFLHFEDSGIKIAGASSGDIDCNHS